MSFNYNSSLKLYYFLVGMAGDIIVILVLSGITLLLLDPASCQAAESGELLVHVCETKHLFIKKLPKQSLRPKR